MLFAAATHTAKAGTSIIGTVLHPIFVLVGYVLAFFYGLIPNYAVAIALLTIAVMIVVFPLDSCQCPLDDADAAAGAGDEEDPGALQGQARDADCWSGKSFVRR